MNQELLLHFDFVLVLVFVCGKLSNLLLSVRANDATLNGSFFVGMGLLKDLDSLLAFALVHLNLDHYLSEHQIGLVSLLLRFAALLNLVVQKRLLALEAVFECFCL